MRGQRHHLVAGRRWSLLCSGAVLCLKASKEGIQLVQQEDGAVTGLWWGLVVRNGLNPLPQAPSASAVTDLYQHISEQQTAHPDAFLILAGDFNHADLKSVFPKIQQHVDFPTRGKNTLDFVYTTQRGAYKTLPLPHLGASDHITVMLMPAHRPLVKVIKPIHKQIQVWPEGSSEALQDCFDTTDWNMFKQAATYNNTTSSDVT